MNVDKSAIIGLLEAAMAADYTAVRRLGSQIAQQFGAAGDLETAKAIQFKLPDLLKPCPAMPALDCR